MSTFTKFVLYLYVLNVNLVDCQTWREIFKINSNVASGSQHPADFYKTGPTTYSNLTQEQIYVDSMTMAHENTNFRSLLINEWKNGNIYGSQVEKVKISFGLNGNEDKAIIFNATTGAVWNTWLNHIYIELSPWTDLTTTSNPSSEGITTKWTEGGLEGRWFAIWDDDISCGEDWAWFLISTWDSNCDWEVTPSYNPGIYWSAGTTSTNLGAVTYTLGHTFVISIYYQAPTSDPTIDPTSDPTFDPTLDPTINPTNEPTNEPTMEPTNYPTSYPTIDPTSDPTIDPTSYPTNDPTSDPSNDPTNIPTTSPTIILTTSTTEGDDGEVDAETTVTDGNDDGEKNDGSGEKNDDMMMMLLIIIGAFIILIFLCLCIYLCGKRKKQRDEMDQNENNIELEEINEGQMTTTTTPINERNSTMNVVPTIETKIERWLNSMGLVQYLDMFNENGFGDMSTLSTLTDQDLITFGITKMAIRKRILMQIQNDRNMGNEYDAHENEESEENENDELYGTNINTPNDHVTMGQQQATKL